MTVKLTANFLANTRGITFADGGGIAWTFNQTTNTLTATGTSGAVLSSVGLASTDFTISGSPLTTNGNITANLAAQTSAGTYTYASLTVNSKGIVTSAANGVQPVTSIGSSNLSVGGTAAVPTINLSAGQVANIAAGGTALQSVPSTTVTAGSYTYSSFTVGADGRLTAASSGTQPVTSITSTNLTVGGTTAVPTINLSTTQATNIGLGGTAVQPAGLPVGATPTGSIGLAAVAGSAATFTPSDGTAALSQAITPAWTGAHTFQNNALFTRNLSGALPVAVSIGGGSTEWNFSGGSAEVNFFNHFWGAAVSFTWSQQTGATAVTQLMALTPAGVLQIPACPLAANGTRAATGLAAFRSADTTSSSNALTADTQLTLTFNEVGKYAIEIFLPFYEATLGTGGFQFDLNSGSATIGGIVYGLDGFVTGAIANAAVTSVATATSAATVATSATAPSWYLAKGWLNVTGAGTLAVRWAQAATLLADPTTLKAGAYFMATKIG
jgi:hypothetical protein